MPDLLGELEAVVRDQLADDPRPRFAGVLEIRCANFIRTHHAEIAAAVRDAERWRATREMDGGAIYRVLGDCDGMHPEQHDTAIDAAMQEAKAHE